MMAYNGQTVSIELPEPIFRRLRHIADVTHRSVEDVLTTTFDAALPQIPGVPDEVADDLAAMTLFSDTALWSTAESTLSPEQQHRLTQLTKDSQAQGLTDSETVELTQLIDAYDRVVLRRAKALAILGQRGYDTSPHTDLQTRLDARN